MKKILILSFVCIMLLVMPMSVLAASDVPKNWTNSSEKDVFYLSSDAKEGKYSFAIAGEGAFTASSYQDIKDIPNGSYTLSFVYKCSGTQKNSWVAVKNHGSSEQRMKMEFAEQWVDVSYDIEVTTGNALVALWTETDTTAWTLIDNLSFKDKAGKEYLVNGGFEMVSENVSLVGMQADTKAPTTIANRYFDKWTIYSSVSKDQAYMIAGGHTGKYCGVHYGSAAAYTISTFQELVGVPNGTYNAYVWVKSSGGQEGASFVVNSAGKKYVQEIPATDEWTKLQISDIKVTDGRIDISVWSDSPAGKWIKYDDMTLVNVNNQSKNLVANPSFENFGSAPETEEDKNTGAQGAAGDEETSSEDTMAEEEAGGMVLNEEDDFDYGDYDANLKESSKLNVDILLVIGIAVISLCFMLSLVTFLVVVKPFKKKEKNRE